MPGDDGHRTPPEQRRGRLVPVMLVAAFLVFTTWQILEYRAWRDERLAALEQRTDDIANAVAGVVNQQAFRRLYLSSERIEDALRSLVQADERLLAVTLNSQDDRYLAQVGDAASRQSPAGPDPNLLVATEVFPAAIPEADEELDPIIILSPATYDTIMQRLRETDWRRRDAGSESGDDGRQPRRDRRDRGDRGTTADATSSDSEPGSARPQRRSRFSPELFRARLQEIVAEDPALAAEVARSQPATISLWLDLQPIRRDNRRDLIVRILGIAMAGLALFAAWRSMNNLRRSAALSVELVQEREKNRYLQDMQLAAAGLAHETRNPLNVVRGIAQSLPRHAADPDKLASQTETIVDEVDRINSRLSQFIAYSKPRQAQFATVDLAEVGREIGVVMADELEEKDLTFSVEVNDLKILADREMLRQMIFNFVMNAIHATPEGGRITLAAGRSGRQAYLSIADTGPGVPASAQEDIFKPYFTLDPTGTGLGLAIVQQFANAHDWRLSYHDAKPHGAIFRLDQIDTAS